MNFISDQQKEIVYSNAKYKLINGCAGSHKTDTLIKCAIIDLERNQKPILFLTLVGSITDELKSRLEKSLGIEIHKFGGSNHHIGYYNEIPICISNYDAWIHFTLEFNGENMEPIGDCFSEKFKILLDKSKKENIMCWMKGKRKVGSLYIDEAQDLKIKKCK